MFFLCSAMSYTSNWSQSHSMVTRNDIISHMASNHFQPKGQLAVATALEVAVCLIKTYFIYEGYEL